MTPISLSRRTQATVATVIATLLGTMATLAPATSQAADKFTYLTNWYAQAEHGGFYQAQATGLYAKAGLDVAIKMGGPQVNLLQLLVAGQADCIMGSDVQTLKAHEQGIDVVTVGAVFQKDAAVIIAHQQVKRFEALKGKTILIGSAGMVTFWPWMKTKYGFTDAQMRPYTFSIQPFLADKELAQQGYLASEPFSIEKETKVKPTVFLLADLGWPPYATTIVCMANTVKTKPKQVAAFVKASMEGWRSYLTADPAPANALIKKDNPNMSDELIANGIAQMKSAGVVFGGDAATMGVGIMTDARMKATYDMMVQNKLLDASKVDLKKTYTTQFVKDLKVMP
jgi:NitT/TauT family transport system substrate-binding protein